MTRKYFVAIAGAAMAVGMCTFATAQPYGPGGRPAAAYEDGYRDGYDRAYRDAYRAGFNDARDRRRYDDRYRFPGVRGPGGAGASGDRDGRWRQRYSRVYTYQDDVYYRDCRTQTDPGGVIAGALIGGLLGNAVGRGSGQGAATVAGVIVGGAVGASLTSKLDCRDRSYAYRTYYDGFNTGRANASYRWRNPDNGHYGDFRVADYYNDPDGFRCANYSQVIYINGRPEETRGRACQQPNGTWAIIS